VRHIAYFYTNNHFNYCIYLNRVTVSDINDNAPLFDHLPSECVVVTEFHTVGDMILLIKATDADDPTTVNGRIMFSIEDGNERGW